MRPNRPNILFQGYWRRPEATVAAMPSARECKCGSALSHALITDKQAVPDATRKKLELLIAKYFA